MNFLEALLSEGSNRGMFFDSDKLREMTNGLQESPPWSLLKEKIISDYRGFWLDRNSFMYDPMNRLVERLVESGTAQHIVNQYNHIKKFAEDSGPKVLTLEHLKAGFCVWLVCSSVAMIGFLCEKCFGRKICC